MKFLRNSSPPSGYVFFDFLLKVSSTPFHTEVFNLPFVYSNFICDVSLPPYLAQIIPDLGLTHFSPHCHTVLPGMGSASYITRVWPADVQSHRSTRSIRHHRRPRLCVTQAVSAPVTLKQACLADYSLSKPVKSSSDSYTSFL